MKRAIRLVVLLLVFAYVLLLAQPLRPAEKPQEAAPANKPLSTEEIRQLNSNIEWIRKNSSDIDRRMFDLGSKQFDISWTMWYTGYLALAIMMGVLAVVLTLVGWLGTIWARSYVERYMEKASKETLAREHGIMGYFSWIHGLHDRAINLSEQSLQLSTEGSADYWMAVNNLAYFYAERGGSRHRDRAIELANKLKSELVYGKAPKDLPHWKKVESLNTYAFVVSVYWGNLPNPKVAVQDTIKMLEETLEDTEATESNKQNARKHLEKLRWVLTTLPDHP
jgi:hypothetical protein